jgi:hypothetical protein
MKVTSSLARALRRLRDKTRVRYLWVDALCINQQDEAGKKTTQIPVMWRIYQHSSIVTIYLGGYQDGSDMIPPRCERIMRAYNRSRMSVQEAQHTQHAINTDSDQELGLPEVNSGHWEIMN